ncbi:hypothetical protein DI09_6p330 [Mitosporidium daphniae]|uniref:Farnesyl pyrophosphate synthase n=1 Tax=Mitosporidium daphniae TaxID=1485682 RepID=A0A098VNU3_9MICR|nr:uncharacterized protein DI09_6p330 [Mitosporidium daphniae]KGG50449.1 hypothetical protein DI09_6p330 [Mitosporidium daphniae]|eukprot:XP_013236876.1 uncharacterized protein DI09_6p330 [Mitosporidium daphniae]
MQTFFLVADDIMDESCLRRNKLCWYKKVGLSAINDSILLESFLFLLLKMHFQDRPHTHIGLFSLFRDVILRTSLGQALDMKCESLKSPQMSFERYQQIVVYKTGFYTFYLPVKSALILKGIDIDDAHLMPILLGLGELFQIQVHLRWDDYLDCFGDPSITGKIGTDIQDFKCSWCVLTALSIDGDACDVLKVRWCFTLFRRIMEKNLALKPCVHTTKGWIFPPSMSENV